MKSVNKILSLVLCLTMVLGVFAIMPFAAGAAEADVVETGASSGTTGDCTWTLDDDGLLTISGNGAMGNDEPHPWGTNISKVIIEEGVTSIGDLAFFECAELTSIDIPDSVTSIGWTAFADCTGLTNVTIGNSVTIIDDEAFSGCTGLTSIDIPDSVTSIGFLAINNCTGLTNITIPDSVTSIGGSAFSGCTSLTSIAIPDSVSSIGSYAIPNTTHICCSPGSEAETYAKNNGNSYGHDYVLTPIDAENHQGVCSYCGDKTEPEAHTFTDGVCTSCGYKEPLIELVDGYFYIDGLLAKGKGAVEYAGDIYFVRNNGSVFTSGKLYVTEAKANGILTAGTYYFDAEGKLINSGVVGGYYFENRKIAKGAGIIEFENNIYYIRNDGSAAVSTKIGIPEAKTNGLISSGYYSFDEAGRLISDGIVDGYYYKDCVIVKSTGIVQFEGDLYYIRNDGSIFTSGRLTVTEPKSNGLIEAGTYRFDGDGKLIK